MIWRKAQGSRQKVKDFTINRFEASGILLICRILRTLLKLWEYTPHNLKSHHLQTRNLKPQTGINHAYQVWNL